MLTTIAHIALFIIFVILPIFGMVWLFVKGRKSNKVQKIQTDEQSVSK